MTAATTKAAIDILIVDWNAARNVLAGIRRCVFIDEQGVPAELEWDELDAMSTHFLASIEGIPVATARFTPAGQIGRMAVLPTWRHRGIASAMLRFVLEHARALGFKRVFLHAQVQVTPLYQTHGFTPEGDIFLDAGIEHRAMFLDLCRTA